jgi:hypothetical protein
MGLFDLIFGTNRSKGDDPEDEIERNKAYGNLYEGGQGRVDHSKEEELSNPHAMKRAERLSGGLDEVARRAKDMQLDENRMERTFGKIGSAIEKVGEAKNSNVMRQRQQDLRHKMRSSYAKIEQEHENRIEELKRKGATDRRIKDEENKMRKTRDDMSSMYRRAGGSGMLK